MSDATAFFQFRFPLTEDGSNYANFDANGPIGDTGNFEVFNDNGNILQSPPDAITVDGQPANWMGIYTGPTAFSAIQPFKNFNIVVEQGGQLFVYSNFNTFGAELPLPDGVTVNFQTGDPQINPSGGELCLLAGALIATPNGAVPIETLRPGDLVSTPDGPQAVKFLGLTTRPVFQLRTSGKMPIRIEAGALGELGPSAPLHCTPTHAFAIKGCLVEAQALINGTTIKQLDSWDDAFITYYSIELESHNLIWANELLSETYFANVRDKGFTRDSWNNYFEYVALYGKGEATNELVMPRIPFARQLPEEIRVIANLPLASEAELLPLTV